MLFKVLVMQRSFAAVLKYHADATPLRLAVSMVKYFSVSPDNNLTYKYYL